MGYCWAGFENITGVDIAPQPRYPFEFVQGDALEFLAEHGRGFDFIHASPPCQGYSVMRHLPSLAEKEYPLLIDPLRILLQATGRHYVIENVMGAKLDANWLCGGMFDLPMYRHRYFESNFLWFAPDHPPHVHSIRRGRKLGSRSRDIVHSGYKPLPKRTSSKDFVHPEYWENKMSPGVAVTRIAMQIDWMTGVELCQAIPPAYTQYVGTQWLNTHGAQDA